MIGDRRCIFCDIGTTENGRSDPYDYTAPPKGKTFKSIKSDLVIHICDDCLWNCGVTQKYNKRKGLPKGNEDE